ncbi:hypothetical protein CQW23_17255 [Capsicum baccatum]|uniref:Histone-lysine N-methyltransferase ATXR2 n=1 Tax=Capsicum baccatum TaxID=33114 RepID=A0A2G2WDP3_CAPBA|nr:hypothetical protein CQW23_17255 [Capsicum baccatum]
MSQKKWGKLSKKGVKITRSRCKQVGHNKTMYAKMNGMGSSNSSQPSTQPAASWNPPPPQSSSICGDTSVIAKDTYTQSQTTRSSFTFHTYTTTQSSQSGSICPDIAAVPRAPQRKVSSVAGRGQGVVSRGQGAAGRGKCGSSRGQCGAEKGGGSGRGQGRIGVYAETDFKEEDLVLKDQMLAGAQHTSNKVDCLVCSYCFCFIGSIELQIGRKLYLEQLGVSSNNECHMEKDCDNSDSSVGEDDSDVEDQQVSGECSSSPSKDKISLPKDVVESLFHGEMKLPYSEKFSLPPIVSCPGGCKENYYCRIVHFLFSGVLHLLLISYQTAILLRKSEVISFTILRHKKLKEGRHEGKGKQVISESIDFSLLGQAWKPVSMGYKRRWWDCIALPDDVDGSDEASFRMQIKELALTVILLGSDVACLRFPPSLQSASNVLKCF